LVVFDVHAKKVDKESEACLKSGGVNFNVTDMSKIVERRCIPTLTFRTASHFESFAPLGP
jgi:hypothetical protein